MSAHLLYMVWKCTGKMLSSSCLVYMPHDGIGILITHYRGGVIPTTLKCCWYMCWGFAGTMLACVICALHRGALYNLVFSRYRSAGIIPIPLFVEFYC